MSTLTFGASLHTLVSRPALYGWNWDYELSGGGGVGNVPAAAGRDARSTTTTTSRAGRTRTSARCRSTAIASPAFGATPNAAVGPPQLSGHAARRARADRARRHHPRAAAQTRRRHRGGQHRRDEAGHAADRRHRDDARDRRQRIRQPAPGDGNRRARSRTRTSRRRCATSSATRRRARTRSSCASEPASNRPTRAARLDAIARKLSLPTNYGVTVDVGAASGRDRQLPLDEHDAAVPRRRARGRRGRRARAHARHVGAAAPARPRAVEDARLHAPPTRGGRRLAVDGRGGDRQRSSASRSASCIGPSALGLFARQIHVVPEPTVPALAICLVALGALVLANLVAAIPGRQAARTKTAVLLRAE